MKEEIEFKWSVESKKEFNLFLSSAKTLGLKISRPKLLKIKDHYLDTVGRHFGQRQISCRARNIATRWELTLKSRTPLKNGLAQRHETTYSLEKLKTFAPPPPFTLLFRILNTRTKRKLTHPKFNAELCFDDVRIKRGDKTIPMLEIELEYLSGDLKAFQTFIESITRQAKLTPAKISKVRTALKVFKL